MNHKAKSQTGGADTPLFLKFLIIDNKSISGKFIS